MSTLLDFSCPQSMPFPTPTALLPGASETPPLPPEIIPPTASATDFTGFSVARPSLRPRVASERISTTFPAGVRMPPAGSMGSLRRCEGFDQLPKLLNGRNKVETKGF